MLSRIAFSFLSTGIAQKPIRAVIAIDIAAVIRIVQSIFYVPFLRNIISKLFYNVVFAEGLIIVADYLIFLVTLSA